MMSDGEILVSELEKPCAKDEILSFADKYVRGEKNRAFREFPFDCELKEEIRYTAHKIYRRLNLSGVVRTDFLGRPLYGRVLRERGKHSARLARVLFLEGFVYAGAVCGHSDKRGGGKKIGARQADLCL